MRLAFTKVQGCGNDYILLDRRTEPQPAEDIAAWSVRLSRRRTAVGADGILWVGPPQHAGSDAAMRIYNADGSQGQMCGNGVRCVAQYLYTHGLPRPLLHIDTAAGRRTLRRLREGVWQADMGRFSALAAALPAVGLGDGPLVDVPLPAGERRWRVSCISMGNPHCVVPWPQDGDAAAPLPAGAALAALAAPLERHPAFPERTNVEFVAWRDAAHLELHVWERGSGETMACGTGACAGVAAMVLRGLCPRERPVEVALPGGTLTVQVRSDDTVFLSGPAVLAFRGEAEV